MPPATTQPCFRPALTALAALWLALAASQTALAGGGPENLLLVVNARSWASMTVANHYIALRDIPESNVLWLDWAHDIDTIDLETFRSELLKPITETISARRLGDQIDYIVYSSDFPWSIDCSAQLGNASLPRHLAPTVSLNAATYFGQAVASGKLDFFSLEANRYFQGSADPQAMPDSHGFRSWYGWGPGGRLLEAGGDRYLLSTMLGITSGRGMPPSMVVDYLTRSAAADGTHPSGTIYYARSSDVRSQTRQPGFAAAILELQALGVASKVVVGEMPVGRDDVQGAMLGSASYSWSSANSTIRPGAICESLTSTGGVMHDRGGQTPLTESLVHGAAGSSGTVTEPFAIQAKFPTPAIHVHYARGCTLAEAFYQSVHGPFQLLIVGDPLCRPWANVPQVTLEGIESGQAVVGALSIKPSATLPGDGAVDRFELLADGVRVDRCTPGESFSIDTSRISDGWHELRVVAIEAGPIESQGRLVVPFESRNHSRQIELTASHDGNVTWGEPLELTVRAPGALGCVILSGNLGLARINGEQGSVTIDPRRLGLGPVELRAIALGNGGATTNVASKPIQLNVQPPPPLHSQPLPKVEMTSGLLLTTAAGQQAAVIETTAERWMQAAGVEAGQTFQLRGWYGVNKEGMYQFQVRHAGSLKISVDGHAIYEEQHEQPQRRYVPVALAAGFHDVVIEGVAADPPRLDLRLGMGGVPRVYDRMFQHPLYKEDR